MQVDSLPSEPQGKPYMTVQFSSVQFSRSVVSNSATLWTVAYQAPPSMGFSRQENWSGLPLPSPGYLPNPGVEHRFPSLQANVLSSKPPHLTSVQFSSVQSLSCVRLCDPMNRSTPGLPVHHQLLEFTQIHFHQVSDAIQPSHPLSSPSPPAPNPSHHHSLFQ